MAVKIRLARGGRKKKPYYWITVADARAPRDGKFLERIGVYNPMTNPATVSVDMERALYWLDCGATPTDTARNLLSSQGVLYKRFLLRGVKLGKIKEDQVVIKFEEWQKNKTAKITSSLSELEKKKLKAREEKNKAEAAVAEKKKADRAAKLTEAAQNAIPAEENIEKPSEPA